MIGRLRGEIVYRQPPYLMLEVNGVGYELEAPMSTFYDLPLKNEQVVLFTHFLVRDDAQILYGFASESERTLFRTLLRISGVGAKMALAILSGMSASEFAHCVQNDDTAALIRLPGIGKKTAERLIVEMRDRLDRLEGVSDSPRGVPAPRTATADTPVSDAVGALVALGYKPVEANRMVKAVDSQGLGSEEIIRCALKAVAPRNP